MATEITTTENTSMAPTVTAKVVMALSFDTTTGEGKKRLFNALNTARGVVNSLRLFRTRESFIKSKYVSVMTPALSFRIRSKCFP